MTWDPTDKQGWKRALETSSSPSSLVHPSKKVRFDVMRDKEEVIAINGDVDSDKNIDTIQAKPAKDYAVICELPITGPEPMQSFFRVKKQRPLAAPTQTDVNTTESSVQRTAVHTQGNGQLYNVLQSPYSQVNTSFNQTSASSDASTSARHTHFDHYTDTFRSSSNEVDDFTAKFTTSASPSFTELDLLEPATTTPSLTQVEGSPMTSAFTKSRSLLGQAPTPFSGHQGFLFGNGGDDLDRGHKSDYFDKIKNNPYTAALLPHAPAPGVHVPQNASEARDLFKRGRYGQPKQDIVLQPTVEELQKVLRDLCKRFAKLKAMCDTAGIDATADVWDRTIAIVEGDRPDIKQTLDEDIGKGLKAYTERVERWDKAVGHQAILMKRLNYKQQIAAIEKKIKEVNITASEDIRGGGRKEKESEAAREVVNEWKGHKTRFGRRFSGLIEKN